MRAAFSSLLARTGVGLAVVCGAGACGSVDQQEVRLELKVSGRPESTFFDRDGSEVLLHEATLAFGPLYLCAGEQAGELCDTARLEWLGSSVIDLLSAESGRTGFLHGTSGEVRSWMFDLGYSSQFSQPSPVALHAASDLDGASLRIAGRVRSDEGDGREFLVSLRVSQSESTEQGIPVIRRSGNAEFRHDVTAADNGLLVAFPLSNWIEALDSSGLTESGCDTEVSTPCVISAESETYRRLRNAVTSGEGPQFEWY